MKIDYSTPVTRIDGSDSDLSEFRGQVLLVVNTASACGYTPQYTALQDLYQRFVPHGFSVLGFPCNQFGAKEPGNHGGRLWQNTTKHQSVLQTKKSL